MKKSLVLTSLVAAVALASIGAQAAQQSPDQSQQLIGAKAPAIEIAIAKNLGDTTFRQEAAVKKADDAKHPLALKPENRDAKSGTVLVLAKSDGLLSSPVLAKTFGVEKLGSGAYDMQKGNDGSATVITVAMKDHTLSSPALAKARDLDWYGEQLPGTPNGMIGVPAARDSSFARGCGSSSITAAAKKVDYFMSAAWA